MSTAQERVEKLENLVKVQSECIKEIAARCWAELGTDAIEDIFKRLDKAKLD